MSHQAKFTWGTGPNTVFIAGNFNSWSGSATPLTKLPDGSFAADVPVPWGEKQAFKYVVDGEWKIREDEAKEWDAAGNMNNIYTAPPAPTNTTSEPTTDKATTVPLTTTPDTSAPNAHTTEPSTLLAASAPAAASSGTAPVLGAVSTPVAVTATVPQDAAPKTTDPTPVKIEKTAANAQVGEGPTEDDKTMQERAAEYGTGAVAALGAVVGGAVAAVEKATGVDLSHSEPISVEEAKAKGIDINTLEKKDAETDATSPVGTKPPASAIAALEEKTRELKVAAGANGYEHAPEPIDSDKPKAHDIPAQDETSANHQSVPAPSFSPISDKDPKKNRTLNAPANSDTAGTKPISADPAVSPVEAKKTAEANQGATGSTAAAAQGKLNGADLTLSPGETSVSPDAKNVNVQAPPTPTKELAAKPSTPAKPTSSTAATPSTATSTPQGHKREETSGSDMRKRKSSFFSKIKHAFSPNKDNKEKK